MPGVAYWSCDCECPTGLSHCAGQAERTLQVAFQNSGKKLFSKVNRDTDGLVSLLVKQGWVSTSSYLSTSLYIQMDFTLKGEEHHIWVYTEKN